MSVIDEKFYASFAFPCALLIDHNRIFRFCGGALFPPPESSQDESQVHFYNNTTLGWSVCPLGYGAYKTHIDVEGRNTLVIYGLKVRGLSKKHGKESVLTINVLKDTVESYAKKTINSLRESEDLMQSIIRMGNHELRNINKDIYNASYALRQYLEGDVAANETPIDYAKNIEALSETLRIRADVFDIVSNPSLLRARGGKYSVYRVFDRMRRSLKPTAVAKGVEISMVGDSQGRTDGVKLFDVIPYLLIQNAIKYSPEGTYIHIDIRETQEEISLNLSSYGPVLEPDLKVVE